MARRGRPPFDPALRAYLRRLRDEQPGLSVRQLAERSGVARSTVHRILRSSGEAPAAARPTIPVAAEQVEAGIPVAVEPAQARTAGWRWEPRSPEDAARALALWRNPFPQQTDPDPFVSHPADRGLPGWVRPWG